MLLSKLKPFQGLALIEPWLSEIDLTGFWKYPIKRALTSALH